MSKLSVLHDSDVHRHPQMVRLIQKGGYEHYGMYWAFVEYLREQPDLEVKTADLDAAFFTLRIDPNVGNDFIADCIALGMLSQERDITHCPALRKRVSRYERVKEANRRRQNKYREKQGGALRNAGKSVTPNTNYNNNTKNKEGGSGGDTDPQLSGLNTAPDFSGKLHKDEITQLMLNHADHCWPWLEHQIGLARARLKETGETPKSFCGYMEKWLMRAKVDYGDTPAKFLANQAKQKLEEQSREPQKGRPKPRPVSEVMAAKGIVDSVMGEVQK